MMIIKGSQRIFYKIVMDENDLGLLDHTDFSTNEDCLLQASLTQKYCLKGFNNFSHSDERLRFITRVLFVFGKIKQLGISQLGFRFLLWKIFEIFVTVWNVDRKLERFWLWSF